MTGVTPCPATGRGLSEPVAASVRDVAWETGVTALTPDILRSVALPTEAAGSIRGKNSFMAHHL